MISQLASYCQIPQEVVEDLLQKTGWGDAYEKGEIDSRTLFHRLPPAIQGKRGFARWVEAVGDVFEPNDAIIPVIKRLKQEGVRLSIFSNICEVHFSYAFPRFPSFHLFDSYLLSYEVKMKKPDPLFYDFALKKTDTRKEQAFFVEEREEFSEKARQLSLHSSSYADAITLQNQLKVQGFLS